jgi:putative transposase
MPFICVYIHFVWSTKYRVPFLESPSTRLDVWKHIRQNGLSKGIHVDFVGGWVDHCHCIVSMKSNQSMDTVVQMIKGESSRFVNQSGICNGEFSWQRGYYAAAIQFERLNQVREYIKNQEQHHRSELFTDEYERMLREMGFQKVDLEFD